MTIVRGGGPWGFGQIYLGGYLRFSKNLGGVHFFTFFRVLLHFFVTIFWSLPPSPLCASMIWLMSLCIFKTSFILMRLLIIFWSKLYGRVGYAKSDIQKPVFKIFLCVLNFLKSSLFQRIRIFGGITTNNHFVKNDKVD